MNWQTLLPEELSPLVKHLTLEKVLVDRDASRLLVCFLSGKLVEEAEYLQLRKALSRGFPGIRVSLRVCSPARSEKVRQDLSPFTPVLTDCLARSSPGVRPWLKDAVWEISGDRLKVSVSSEAALRYVRHVELDKRLVALMADVFRMKIEAVFVCEEDERAQRERLELLEEKAREAVLLQAEQAKRHGGRDTTQTEPDAAPHHCPPP